MIVWTADDGMRWDDWFDCFSDVVSDMNMWDDFNSWLADNYTQCEILDKISEGYSVDDFYLEFEDFCARPETLALYGITISEEPDPK